MKKTILKTLTTAAVSLTLLFTVGCVKTPDLPKLPDTPTPEVTCEHDYCPWTLHSGEYCETLLYYKKCSKCEDVQWKNGSDKDHNWEVVEKDSAADDYLLKCTICNKTEYAKNITHYYHIWDKLEIVISEPTCGEAGVRMRNCILCYYAEMYRIPPTGEHTPGTLYSHEDDGHWLVCTECKTNLEKESHSFGDDGICSVCGHVKK